MSVRNVSILVGLGFVLVAGMTLCLLPDPVEPRASSRSSPRSDARRDAMQGSGRAETKRQDPSAAHPTDTRIENGNETIREWLRQTLDADEARAREEFVVGFRNEVSSAATPGYQLVHPESAFFPLNELRSRPQAYSILMSEREPLQREWDTLTKVNVLFDASGITDFDKQEIGSAFLRVIGERVLADSIDQDIAALAVEIQSRVASIGEGFSETQAQRVAFELRGLVSGQARVNLLARLVVLPEYSSFTSAEVTAVSEAFHGVVVAKREGLTAILGPPQLAKLYGECSYDSLAYWRRRLNLPAVAGER